MKIETEARTETVAAASCEAMRADAVTRRGFLRIAAANGGGLLLGVALPPRARGGGPPNAATPAQGGPTSKADADAADAPCFNAFVQITRDDRILLTMSKVEMGQGTRTMLATLICEELDVGLDQITCIEAPPDDKAYPDLLMHFQATGGSTSTRGAWEPMRQAGATARTMLIAAAAKTWGVDALSCGTHRGHVRHAPSGRSSSYGSLAEAAARLPPPHEVRLRTPDEFKLIGKAIPRLDTPAKVNGSARYTVDLARPGMLHASVLNCPVLGGRLRSLDEAAARAIDGVRDVLRLPDAVAVAAEHSWAAQRGLSALAVEWDLGPNSKVDSALIERHLEMASGRRGVVAVHRAAPGEAIKTAHTRIDAVYALPLLAHAALEPMSCMVEVRPAACELWVGTQVPSRARQVAAQAARMPLENVQVHNQLIGGAFGRRLETDFIEQAVRFARQVQAPLKLVWTREQDIRHGRYRPAYRDVLSAGVDARGNLLGLTDLIAGSSVMARFAPEAMPAIGLDEDAVEGIEPCAYDFAALHVEFVREEPPGLCTAFWRGVGPTHNVFVLESFLDEIAVATRQDPLAFRRTLIHSRPRARAILDLAAARAGWGRAMPAGRGQGIALSFAFGSYLACVAEVEVDAARGLRVERLVTAVDCGFCVNPDTVRAQVEGGLLFGLSAALFNEITVRDGRVQQGNFNDYRQLRIDEVPTLEIHLMPSCEPPGGIGETGTVIVAPAVANAIFAATGQRLRRLPFTRAGLHVV